MNCTHEFYDPMDCDICIGEERAKMKFLSVQSKEMRTKLGK